VQTSVMSAVRGGSPKCSPKKPSPRKKAQVPPFHRTISPRKPSFLATGSAAAPANATVPAAVPDSSAGVPGLQGKKRPGDVSEARGAAPGERQVLSDDDPDAALLRTPLGLKRARRPVPATARALLFPVPAEPATSAAPPPAPPVPAQASEQRPAPPVLARASEQREPVRGGGAALTPARPPMPTLAQAATAAAVPLPTPGAPATAEDSCQAESDRLMARFAEAPALPHAPRRCREDMAQLKLTLQRRTQELKAWYHGEVCRMLHGWV
jgi:hypothetical protein